MSLDDPRIRSMPTAINPLDEDTPLGAVHSARYFADYLEITESSLRAYMHAGKVPNPDGYIGNLPVWHILTIAKVSLQRSEDKRHNPEHYTMKMHNDRESAEAGEETRKREERLSNIAQATGDETRRYDDWTQEDIMAVITSRQEDGRDVPELLLQVALDRGYIA